MKNKLLLILIIFIGGFLRFYKLGDIPNSYSPDELAQGYTAYSILQTGRDEWGNSNWSSLRSFGDYKPPLQTLLMIPSIKIFGLNTFAIRLPNAFFSVITILLTYLISLEFFKNKKISLLSALFISLSPWAMPMSRIALEANLIIFIISSAVYFYLLASKKQSMFFYIFSAVFLGLSLITYHSAKIFSPLLLILLIIFKKTYRQLKLLIPTIIIFLFFFGFNLFLNSQIKINRTGDIAIFNPTDKWSYVSSTQFEMKQNGLPAVLVKIIYNKITYIYKTFSRAFLSYFSPEFLITQGAGETTYGVIPSYGVLGLIPGIGLLLLFIMFIKKDLPKKNFFILFILLILIPPAIAAIAKGFYSANRVSLMIPFLQILSASGIVLFLEKYLPKFKQPLFYLTMILVTLSSGFFIIRYFAQGNQILAEGMLYGHKQANEYIKNHPSSQIIYSRKLSEPQAYAAFFNQINPKITQKESPKWLEYEKNSLSLLDQLGEYSLDKFIFREINIPSDSQLPDTLIVGRPEEFRDVKPDYIIYYPDHSQLKPSIYIYKTKL